MSKEDNKEIIENKEELDNKTEEVEKVEEKEVLLSDEDTTLATEEEKEATEEDVKTEETDDKEETKVTKDKKSKKGINVTKVDKEPDFKGFEPGNRSPMFKYLIVVGLITAVVIFSLRVITQNDEKVPNKYVQQHILDRTDLQQINKVGVEAKASRVGLVNTKLEHKEPLLDPQELINDMYFKAMDLGLISDTFEKYSQRDREELRRLYYTDQSKLNKSQMKLLRKDNELEALKATTREEVLYVNAEKLSKSKEYRSYMNRTRPYIIKDMIKVIYNTGVNVEDYELEVYFHTAKNKIDFDLLDYDLIRMLSEYNYNYNKTGVKHFRLDGYTTASYFIKEMADAQPGLIEEYAKFEGVPYKELIKDPEKYGIYFTGQEGMRKHPVENKETEQRYSELDEVTSGKNVKEDKELTKEEQKKQAEEDLIKEVKENNKTLPRTTPKYDTPGKKH